MKTLSICIDADFIMNPQNDCFAGIEVREKNIEFFSPQFFAKRMSSKLRQTGVPACINTGVVHIIFDDSHPSDEDCVIITNPNFSEYHEVLICHLCGGKYIRVVLYDESHAESKKFLMEFKKYVLDSMYLGVNACADAFLELFWYASVVNQFSELISSNLKRGKL